MGGIFYARLNRACWRLSHPRRNIEQAHFGNPIFLTGNYLKIDIMRYVYIIYFLKHVPFDKTFKINKYKF